MRNLSTPAVDEWRDRSRRVLAMYGGYGDGTCGAFNMPSPIDGANLRIIAAAAGGWDHVSVSRTNRCPNWIEMEYVKRAFFNDDEVAMELHVRPSEHLSLHAYCLHLWRPNDGRDIPMPPAFMVAPPTK